MTTTLNATTSNGLVVTPDNSGNILLQYNGVAAPAFSAYLSSNQTVTSAAFTKLQAATEEFDTASCYDNSTNYRFTPTVAGYYQISGSIYMAATSNISGSCLASIYKNGSRFKDGSLIYGGNSTSFSLSFVDVSALVYLNGSTDYVELYGLINGGGTCSFQASTPSASYFQGCLLRGA